MNKFFTFLAVLMSIQVNAIELNKAAVCDGISETKNQTEMNAAKIIGEIYKTKEIDTSSVCLGWTNMGGGSIWFDFISDMKIHSTNVETKQYLGGWNLGSKVCADSDDEDCVAPWWEGRWGSDEVFEQDIIGQYPGDLSWTTIYPNDPNIMGCMQQKPLRYGDLDGDDVKELVLFLSNYYSTDIAIFSTIKHKTIFASKLDFNDVVKHEALADIPDFKEIYPELDAEKSYQFWSRSGVDENRKGALSQAFRGFAKIYVDHFSTESSNDILVWRKAYKSRWLKDSIKGFEKISDKYIHYKLVDGEYKKQPTEQSVIKGWLEAKNLTWQKGYPSKSECPGQEGKLIPEMHDPLLNDPDVLR